MLENISKFGCDPDSCSNINTKCPGHVVTFTPPPALLLIHLLNIQT